jgi:hypothetical protein
MLDFLRFQLYRHYIYGSGENHCVIKSRTGPMLGFKRFDYAPISIAGVELLRRIHKDRFALGPLRVKDRAAPAIWNAVLSA